MRSAYAQGEGYVRTQQQEGSHLQSKEKPALPDLRLGLLASRTLTK